MAKLKIKKEILWTLLVVVLIAAIIIPIVIVYTAAEQDNGNRIACFPLMEKGNDTNLESVCNEKGCIYDAAATNVKCYLPLTGTYGYEHYNSTINSGDGTYIQHQLRRRQGNPSLYGGDIEDVQFKLVYYGDTMLRFTFFEKGKSVESNQPPVGLDLPPATAPSENSDYIVKVSDSSDGVAFDFTIRRRSSDKIILDTKLGGLTIAKQFLMITFALPSQYLYGIGENTHDSFVHNLEYKMHPIFARDQPPGDGEMNLYGSHPFYMVSEDDGSSHGVFLFNSHAIDVTTLPYPGLTYRTIGGGLDFFVFLGPKPEDVVKQYTEIIGRTMMPAYWSLGFQLSRYGYNGTSEIREVVERTRNAFIPQDVQYADIDHMDNQADFTLGPNFQDLPDFVIEQAVGGLRFIPILDPAINTEKVNINYTTHTNAMNVGAYITWYNDTLQPDGNCTTSSSNCQPLDNIMLGYVWPDGRTAFPDFFKSETQDWWKKEMKTFHEKLPYDGIWIDMNEPAAFDTNKEKPFNYPPELPPWNLICPENEWDDPPYITLSASRSATKRLSDKTICMVGRQGQNNEYLHYAVHNLYGWSQTKPTYEGLQSATGKRGIVITRSTFPSSGKHAGHWLGDNTSRWKDLHSSIIGSLEFNLFGIPYIGADICGFFEPTTEELCARWMELGAFYPFSRNHNTFGMPPQDPAIWSSVASASKTALNIRYRLLPYLYTLFYHSHTTGSTVVRPLYHEYPTDLRAKSVDTQFLWGPALLISPVLVEKATELKAYLPSDTWYDYYTGKKEATSGTEVTWNTPLEKINLHVRGGYILPQQIEGLNTKLSRQNNFTMIVALNSDNAAAGDLFWDDGETINTVTNNQYYHIRFSYAETLNNDIAVEGVLTMEVQTNTTSLTGLENLKMDSMSIFGLSKTPTSVDTGDVISYSPDNNVAYLTNLNRPMISNWKVVIHFD
ncbi:sucrase-isomaltase, intestinal-like isoform X2 [Daphnia pulex]|uniref:sucrase-isomaltase, intestinal-like isoform X2 n=1 Tax=Daphnia pulex TaxID=6669 RepID=UPI001EDE9802|nr:sucrase-isomaltase, intestinal-like isoform X2 [Daphnia pulex]